MNYKYFMPTKIVMGKNCITENKDLFKPLGFKAMIVTGVHSAKMNGSQEDVIYALDAVGIDYLVFDKVMSNPTVSCVYEGASIAKANGVDFIIAIGGGSPMDAGKGIALLAAQDISEENLFSGEYLDQVLPMAFVPTTAGTGSEVTQYSILTNDKAQTKTSIATELIFPTVAFIDPSYTEKLSITSTIYTAIDALSHGLEGMLSLKASPITDALAVKSIQMIIECIPKLQEALLSTEEIELNYEIREQLIQASLLAGMVIAQTGTIAVHAMGYSLTYFKHIDHGRANGLLLAEYLRFIEHQQPDLAGRILNVMALPNIDLFSEMLNQLLGDKETISIKESNQYSKLAIQTKNILNCSVKPTEENLREILEQSLKFE